MRLFVVLLGIALVVAGLIPIIIGTNELLTLNDCASGGRTCYVTKNGICASDICTIDPFYGQTTIEGVRELSYDLIEIGAVIAIAGAIVAIIGRRAIPSSK